MTELAGIAPPEGFAIVASGDHALVADQRRLPELRRVGLDEPWRWEELLAAGEADRSGRGGTLAIKAGPRSAWRLKKLRRGGLLGPLWRDRFAGPHRALQNLRTALAASRRGVPTAQPVAVMLREGPSRLFQAWLASEEIEGAQDLRSRLCSGVSPSMAELAAAMRAVRRMHDAGIRHRDLNLGNLLVRRTPGAEPQAFVIDLDRAVLHEGPLSLRARRASLHRLQRSFYKLLHTTARKPWSGARWWITEYACEGSALRVHLERRVWQGDLVCAIHRLGWRRRE